MSSLIRALLKVVWICPELIQWNKRATGLLPSWHVCELMSKLETTCIFIIYVLTASKFFWNSYTTDKESVNLFKPVAHQPLASACLVSWNCLCPRRRYVCVSALKAINYIHMMCNQLNEFVAFRNVTKLSIHRRGLCNEACHDRNQINKAMLVP